ncbi:MAG: Ig-like domain-containing protein [Anaerolineae bacterium]
MFAASSPKQYLTWLLPIALVLMSAAGCRAQTPEPPTTPVAAGPTAAAPQAGPTSAPAAAAPTVAPTADGSAVRARPTPGKIAGLGAASFARSAEGLKVVSTQPKSDATGVPIAGDGSRIVVQFDRPVAPLTSVTGQSALPAPLSLNPPAQGKGEWLNTSTYVFRPDALLPSTRYIATVAPLQDLVGTKLDAPLTFNFTTVYPGVARSGPPDNAKFVSATQPITVTFNQPMNQAQAQNGFSLTPKGGGAVAGDFAWSGATMTFKPRQPLARDTVYTAEIGAGVADAQNKETTKAATMWTFQTAPAPGLLSSTPANGAQASRDILNGLQLSFASPMDRDALRVTVAPTITNQTVAWEDESNTKARVYGSWQPSTAYTVTLGSPSRTRDGEALGKDIVLRFSSAPLDGRFNLGVPAPMAMYDANRPPTLGAAVVNVKDLIFDLYSLPAADVLSFIGPDAYQQYEKFQPAASRRVRPAWTVSANPPLDKSTVVTTTLTTDGKIAPGAYYLRVASPQVKGTPDRHVLIVSDVNLLLKRTDSEALVWATDLKTGQPVSGLPITVYGFNRQPLGQGTTDGDGLLRVKFPKLEDPYLPIYALAERSGQVVGAVGGDWNEGINPFDYNLEGALSQPDYYATLYTDRPLYRPGQTAHFKGILRGGRDGAYTIPPLQSVSITARDALGHEILKTDAPLSAYGTFSGDIPLAPAAPLGYYSISMDIPLPPTANNPKPVYSSSASFQVSEYRKPEFEIAVKTDKSGYVNGETINVTADGAYFFGGPVANAKAKWRLLADDYFFTPPDSVKGAWDFADFDVVQDRSKRRPGEVIREGSGTTDSQGRLTFQMSQGLGDVPISQNYTIEVELTDVNGQSVTSRTVVPLHKANFYIGVAPQQYIGLARQEQRVNLIALDTQGISVTNQALTVNVFRREWYTTRQKESDGRFYLTSVYTDTRVVSLNTTTDGQGKASVTYTPPQAGSYRIVAEGKDSAGNTARSATYQWVAGTEFVNWRRDDNDRMALTADRKTYLPGDTAKILVQSPFAPAEALVTVERGAIHDVRRMSLPTTSTTIEVPLTKDDAPNVYVSVAAVKGGDDTTLPQFKLGDVRLDVSPRDKLLDIALTPQRPGGVQPGQTVTYNIVVKDSDGKPVQGEFSAALVDKALYSLVEDTTKSPGDLFYAPRPLGVGSAATLIRNVNRVTAALAAGGKGGGGGGLAVAPVRRDFQDTGYWKASFTTDEGGRAKLDIPLPDNLTTWTLTVVGVTQDTKVGRARLDTVATKDLLLRPTLPRFLVQGDAVRLGAVVQNNTDRPMDARVTLQTQGFDGKTDPVSVSLPARGKAVVGWDARVGDVPKAGVMMAVAGSGLNDSVAVDIPVARATTPETVGSAGVATDAQRAEEVVRVPADAAPGQGNLTVSVAPSVAAVTQQGVSSLRAYPWEATENVASRFLSTAVATKAASSVGQAVDAAQVKTQMSNDLQKLYGARNLDNGWGWWPGDTSNPFLTAYTLLALTAGQQNGIAVDKNVIDGAADYLRATLDQRVDTAVPGMLSQRAFVLWVLAEIGQPQTGRAVELYNARNDMSLYGQAFLLMALQKADPEGQAARVQALAQNLWAQANREATGTHWEESIPNPLTMNTNLRTTAIALEALGRVDPKDANLPNVVTWLMSQRREDGAWRTPQETAWATRALANYAAARGGGTGASRFTVNLNGQDIQSGEVGAAATQAQMIEVALKNLAANAGNTLTISKSGGPDMYYTEHLTTYRPAGQSQALDRGILVGRTYLAVDPATLKPTGQEAKGVKPGDYVMVKLTLIAPATLNYVVLEDPLPAGFEALDLSLKTTSAAAQAPGIKPVGPPPGQPTAKGYPGPDSPYWSYWTHSEVRDNKVAVFAPELRPGAYEYTYTARASVPGQFTALPATAYEMYFPETFGRSEAASFPIAASE